RTIQPSGPYNLLGWSFGGLVAHAIATQLQADGEQVALLALLDSFPVERKEARSTHDTECEKETLFAGAADDPMKALLASLHREGHILSALEESHFDAIEYTLEKNSLLMLKFVPQRYRGALCLFAATQGEIKPPIESWKRYVDGQINVHCIDSTHENMMESDPAAKIGSTLATELAKKP